MKLITKSDLEQRFPWLVDPAAKSEAQAMWEGISNFYADMVKWDADQKELAHYRDAAQDRFLGDEGDIEVDDEAIVSVGGDNGAYVQAWVWVSDEDAGMVKMCHGCDKETNDLKEVEGEMLCEECVQEVVAEEENDDSEVDLTAMTRAEANDWASADGIGPLESARRQRVVDSQDDSFFEEATNG